MSGGSFSVIVNAARCEGERACVSVCPAGVFTMLPPAPDLGIIKRLKVAFHGGKQAQPVNAAACIGCMSCVGACPGRAINVTPVGRNAA